MVQNERQSAISAFFRPVDKRIRDSETEKESDVRSRSSINSSTSDQASTSRNEDVARNVIALTDQISEESGNNIQTLPMPFDNNMLPNELPTREGRSLPREWFTDFAWLHCNDDGTCHCSSCFWAIKSNRLSRKYKEGIQNSKWVQVVDSWQDYRNGKSTLHIQSFFVSCRKINALQVGKTVFLSTYFYF